MSKLNKNKKIGLALGGGSVLGAAHIGVLRAIEEAEIEICCIAGTSIGAFIAALFAFGKSSNDIKQLTKGLDWLDISSIELSNLGLLSNVKLGKLIVKSIGDKYLEEADLTLAAVATDISSGKKVILKKGSIVDAVNASSALPGIFKPIEINGKLLVDGAVLENVPISPLKEFGAEQIIAVDLNAKHTYKKPENIIDVLLNAFNMTLTNLSTLQTKDVEFIIAPDLSEFNLIETDQFEELIEKGYADTKEYLRSIL